VIEVTGRSDDVLGRNQVALSAEAEMTDRGKAANNDRSRHQGAGRGDEGFEASPSSATGVPDGEEGSILEGEPSRRGMTASDRGETGAGAESAEGIHSTKGNQPEKGSAVEHAHGEPGRGEGAGLSGSEPLRHREAEHKSGYGGEKAEPRTSSDKR
jgi:hypothetical protein